MNNTFRTMPYAADGLGANPSATATTATPRPRSAGAGATRPAPAQKPAPSQRPPSQRKGGHSSKSISRLNPLLSFLTDTRTRLGLGIVLTVLCVTLLIVSINFIKSGPADQSIADSNSVTAIASSGTGVDNVGGPAGARLSHLLMVEGLGLGSFVLVVYLGVLALSLFGLIKCRFWPFTFKCLFTAISLSIIFGLFTYNVDTTFHWGGNHGRYINQWLMQIADVLGAYAVSVILIGLLAVMYLTQIRSLYLHVSGRMARARENMATAAANGRRPEQPLADVPETPAATATGAPTPAPVSAATASAAANKPAAEEPAIGFTIDDMEGGTTAPQSAVTAPSAPTTAVQIAPKPLDIPSGNTAATAVSEPEFKINVVAESAESSDGTPSATVLQDKPFSIRDELSHYRFPGLDLMIDRPSNGVINEQEQEDNKNLIVSTLAQYGIAIARVEATVGPTVTLYEIVPAEGVRIAQIKRLEDDIARNLEALGIRIIAPIRGRETVGIEVPNRTPQTVSMRSVLNSAKFRESDCELPMALGKTVSNEYFVEDLTSMPHLLVAGATGQGKSVGLNCIIASLLYKKHPGELKFVLIDPKMVEFSLYARIERHYLAKLPDEEDPIVTEPSKALATLQALCLEMDQRYALLKSAEVRNIKEYNAKFTARRLNPEKGHRFMPYIVIIVDEFADLIMMAGKDISLNIARIAQKARAVGMHMIIATQRPSTDVITGIIKANFPARIAFRVASMVDSKTILDTTGANRLIGRGDLLFSHNSRMERVQCAFMSTPEVESLVNFISAQTAYETAYMLPEPKDENALAPGAIDLTKRDELFDDCARFVVQNSTASTSSLQRRFGIGYNKAGKIMDQLEAAGIVGSADGQRPRAVLVSAEAVEDLLRTL